MENKTLTVEEGMFVLNQTARIVIAGELAEATVPIVDEEGEARPEPFVMADRQTVFNSVLERWDATFSDLATRLLEVQAEVLPFDEEEIPIGGTTD